MTLQSGPGDKTGAPSLPFLLTDRRYTLHVMLAAFVLLWTAYEIIAHGNGDVHNDMAEAYAWGQELQAGYFKHPPFWAWLTYGWFLMFPISDWSAYLFSALNAAMGMYFVSRCAAYFVADRRLQQMSAFLLMLIPAYTFLAMKMNANTIHLSLWPAITWIFLRLMEKPNALSAVGLGLIAAFAVLSKYNAAIFLICILIASFVHPQARRFWRSPLPLWAVLGGLPLVIVHGIWLWNNDFLPFHYFNGLRSQSAFGAIKGGVLFLIAEMLYALPALVAIVAIGRWSGMQRRAFALTRMHLVLLALAFGPMLLTALLGAVLRTRTPALWGLQNLFLLPVVALQFIDFKSTEAVHRRAMVVVSAFLFAVVLAAPVVAWAKFRYGDRSAIDPRSQVARELTTWWRATFGVPLRIVAGDESYALAATFYSPDHPSYYISRDRRLTPWITDQRLQQGGALFICNETDDECEIEAKNASADRGEEKKISAVKEFLGSTGQNQNFSFFVIPPKGTGLEGAGK